MTQDVFKVQVLTEEKVTTTQRILTGIITFYFCMGASGIAAALYLSFLRS